MQDIRLFYSGLLRKLGERSPTAIHDQPVIIRRVPNAEAYKAFVQGRQSQYWPTMTQAIEDAANRAMGCRVQVITMRNRGMSHG